MSYSQIKNTNPSSVSKEELHLLFLKIKINHNNRHFLIKYGVKLVWAYSMVVDLWAQIHTKLTFTKLAQHTPTNSSKIGRVIQLFWVGWRDCV